MCAQCKPLSVAVSLESFGVSSRGPGSGARGPGRGQTVASRYDYVCGTTTQPTPTSLAYLTRIRMEIGNDLGESSRGTRQDLRKRGRRSPGIRFDRFPQPHSPPQLLIRLFHDCESTWRDKVLCTLIELI